MSKEGFGLIVFILLCSLVLTLGAWVTGITALIVVGVIAWLMLAFLLYFFRDPERITPSGENLIISPADGKVIFIGKEFEPLFFKREVIKVSIFMSPFNVHINRIPIDGKVTYFNYLKGKFHQAFKNKASTENEQTIIGIEGKNCNILFKQIAGIIARRIVCNIREGHSVKKGERFGMIKMGSRADIFLTNQVQLQIKLNEHVKGGESIIGKIDEK